jgi:hypothetical protein
MRVHSDQPLFNPATPLAAESIEKFQKLLRAGEVACKRLGLNVAAALVSKMAEELEEDGPLINCQWLKDQAKNLQTVIQVEMSEKVFVYIPPEMSKFLTSKTNPYLFGQEVQDKAPSAHFENREHLWPQCDQQHLYFIP